jgi:transcriptional regulator with PAS, ATPase and Fis domain
VVNVRIIYATNCDLLQRVNSGDFREDLYYRIKVIELYVPPLRERKKDIAWLTNRFIARFLETYPDQYKTLDDAALKLMLEYNWPGNVRELKHTIERAFILAQGENISINELMLDQPGASGQPCRTLKTFLRTQECNHIKDALHNNNWNINQTASELDICRKALWQKMKRLNIQKPTMHTN